MIMATHKDIAVLIPKKAIVREIESQGSNYYVFAISKGKYKGYQFIYPSNWFNDSYYEDDCLFTYMRPDKTISINKREKDPSTGRYETVDQKVITVDELKEIFKKSKTKRS